MLDIVQMPLARRMWRISKFFQLPINDERIQDMNIYDITFYELSMIADDPKKLEQLQNHFYDEDFDAWLEEFEEEQALKAESASQKGTSENLDMPDKETIVYAENNRLEGKSQAQEPEFDTDYEISESSEIADWEEVN